jgi:GTPase involved in cell partitioning and DNA repair
VEFIEHAEIGLAIPGAKLFLDVEDDEIVIDIPDEAMRLDLAGGQGAGNLNQITDLNRMPGQQSSTPPRGPRVSARVAS